MSKIKSRDILYSITKKIKNKFPNSNVFLPLVEQNINENDFIVNLIPLSSEHATRVTMNKSLMIDIKYISGNDIELVYDVRDELENNFFTGIWVKDRYIKIRNIEHNIIKDNYGNVLQYLIYIDYFDDIIVNEEEHYEVMASLNINLIN